MRADESTPEAVRGLQKRVEGSRHDVAIGLTDGRDRDAAVLADDLDVDALPGAPVGLQVPCDRRVPQRVPDDPHVPIVGRQAHLLDHRVPARADGRDRLVVVLDYRLLSDAKPLPAPHVGEQPRRDWNRGLFLARLFLVVRLALEYAAIEIDIAATDGRDHRRTADIAMPATGV